MPRNRFALLFVSWVAAALPAQDTAAPLAQIASEYQQAHAQWISQVVAGKPGREKPSKRFVDRCLSEAKKHAGTNDAAPYLAWILRNAIDERRSAGRALDTLLWDHANSTAWSGVLDVILHTEALVGGERIDRAIEMILVTSPHDEVVARAHLARAMRRLGRAKDEADRKAATDDLEAARKLTRDETLQAETQALLDTGTPKQPRLVLNSHVDAARIANREGKLLLVSFSGINCATCRAMDVVCKRPGVREELANGYVQSRLHIDFQKGLTKEQFASNLRFREQLASEKFIPYFVVVDPRTGCPIRTHEINGPFGQWQEPFLAFLQGKTEK